MTIVPARSFDCLVLLSGGIDSSTCVAYYRSRASTVEGLYVDYGQPAASNESEAAHAIASHYAIPLHVLRVTGLRPPRSGVIVGRNAALLSLAHMVIPAHISAIALGIHSGTAYPDCSLAFLERQQAIVDLFSAGTVLIDAPFLTWSKTEVYQLAQLLRVPTGLTYSCEVGGSSPCGLCNSCLDRRSLDA